MATLDSSTMSIKEELSIEEVEAAAQAKRGKLKPHVAEYLQDSLRRKVGDEKIEINSNFLIHPIAAMLAEDTGPASSSEQIATHPASRLMQKMPAELLLMEKHLEPCDVVAMALTCTYLQELYDYQLHDLRLITQKNFGSPTWKTPCFNALHTQSARLTSRLDRERTEIALEKLASGGQA
ncbi:hypothetical protein DOTSEDRAFT_22056 [Dothistroma septosporum NZE10]|uniref:F-box domain-containing protein n=1 Tax=Dothistroma septosporum (strain NZE10 / CBS 128990) TaxID=675120 RepID=N1PSM3_DOTSN|nr:hypothetical protein DOTSEDRAFT_22056 [Dothistroma septosporum NZE10]